MLALASGGGFNLHGSLLPRYRGRCPVNWQLVHGERESGLTLHRMVERADAGPIVAQRAIAVGPDQTAFGLYRDLLGIAPALLDEALPAIAAGCQQERPQDEAAASVFGGRRPEDGAIDWSWPARRIHDLVRAVGRPYPGARCRAPDGSRWYLWRSYVAAEDGALAAPGTTLEHGVVCCGRGALRLTELSDEAGRPVDLRPGIRLGNDVRTPSAGAKR